VLIPEHGATGAAIAASAAFLAGGIVAALAYRAMGEMDVKLLVPRRTDFDLIRGQARRIFLRRAG
jgi:hypothetical protein